MRAILVLLFMLVWSSASAQPTIREPDMRLTRPDPELWQAQLRARFLLAFGTGLAAGAAVHAAWAARPRTCGYDPFSRTSLVAARAMGGIGVGFVLGGGSWLAVTSARHGYLRASKGQRWIAAALGVAGFSVSTVVTTLVWGYDSLGCST